ncbi:DUF4124 domain-containing protein [Roseateles sp. DB2]|uniref:DUF4124 domain-containing protein n=1 Tax=Roseateles sp. DB2 TaxID=3453717 RepID=UPI003EEC38D1
MSWRLAAAVLLGLFLPLSASAQVYKCTDSSGKTAYQSQPCPEATQGGQLDLRWTSSALPTLSSSASLSGNVTVSEMRQAIISSCATNVAAKGDATLRRIASTQPAKFRSFCDCVADVSTSDVERLKNMAQRGDRAGLEQLGLRAGLSCASRLQ